MKVKLDMKMGSTSSNVSDDNYQTPPEICEYMVSLLPEGVKTVLEPTPGQGNLVRALCAYDTTAPEDFFLLDPSQKFDAVVLNPPFSHKSANLENAPERLDLKGMKTGHHILTECMDKADIIVALMPWFTISNSDVRLRMFKDFGLLSVTALPRKTFNYIRIQTMVLHLQRGYDGPTEFIVYDRIVKP